MSNKFFPIPFRVVLPAMRLLALVLFAAVFLFIRCPEPITNPIVYAEDGAWIAMGLREGWPYTLFHARDDYFVWLNILLLFFATLISGITSGSLVWNLGYTIAIVSYIFYGSLAVLAYKTMCRILPHSFCLLLFFLILLMPLGLSQEEVFGRLVQIGFHIPFMVLLLLYWRKFHAGTKLRYGIDGLIVLSAGTNPVVFALVAVYLGIELTHTRNISALLKNEASLLVPLAILLIVLLPRMGGTGGIPEPFKASSVLETVGARMILYPLIFPWYRFMNDGTTIAGVLIFCVVVLVSFFTPLRPRTRYILTLSTLSLLVLITATLVMRPGLTSFLNAYTTTFPDRYFMGVNVIALLVLIIALSQLASSPQKKFRYPGIAGSVFVVFVYAIGILHIIYPPRFTPFLHAPPFSSRLCAAQSVPGDTSSVVVIIEPEASSGWRGIIPKTLLPIEKCND
ncbi:MAG: hypothetical protein N2691_01990 [Patescibacteria group bacterium]|nr:hypothetical protein [Patescibacteria group bacterium]